MKKYFLIAILINHLTITAQDKTSKRWSYYVSGGIVSSSYSTQAADKKIHTEKEQRHHACLVLNTGLLFKISGKWKAGPAFTYDHFGTKRRSAEFSNLSYMLKLERTWVQKNKLSIYSSISGGIKRFRKFHDEIEIERKTIPAFHLNLLSAQYQIVDNWFINVEAGWGVAGVISCGSRIYF